MALALYGNLGPLYGFLVSFCLPNLLMGGSVNHHRSAVPFREPQKEKLQR